MLSNFIRTAFCLFFGGMLAFSVAAQDKLSLPAAIHALSGEWSGVLTYRDFRTNERVSIPHDRSISVAADGSFATSENTYTDPGYKVYSAELFRATTDQLTIASTTRSSVEVTSYEMSSLTGEETAWTAVFDGKGSDNGGPADVRMHIDVSPTTLSIRRMVRSDGATEFAFRNEMVFERGSVPTEAIGSK